MTRIRRIGTDHIRFDLLNRRYQRSIVNNVKTLLTLAAPAHSKCLFNNFVSNDVTKENCSCTAIVFFGAGEYGTGLHYAGTKPRYGIPGLRHYHIYTDHGTYLRGTIFICSWLLWRGLCRYKPFLV